MCWWQMGALNSAFNLGNNNTLVSAGVANNTTNVLGNGNTLVASGGTSLTNPGLNSASNFLGNNNTVVAGPGPFAIAECPRRER